MAFPLFLSPLTYLFQSADAESEKKEETIGKLRAEIDELRNVVNQKIAEDELSAASAAANERLQRDIAMLQQEAAERDAREDEAEADRRKLEYLKHEAEMENEDLRRKLVGCENDVARLKVRGKSSGRKESTYLQYWQ